MDLEIEENTVLMFDLDGTLVDTNLANFLSYKEAIHTITQQEIIYDSNVRFNRITLKKMFPDLALSTFEKIIEEKEKLYEDYLHQTTLNLMLAELLTRYSPTNKTILVTNCRKDRAILTLNYHNLTDKFSNLVFRKNTQTETRINKYDNAISSLGLNVQTVLVFENEKQEIEDATLAGISSNKIVSILL